jgi:hypothetical protein
MDSRVCRSALPNALLHQLLPAQLASAFHEGVVTVAGGCRAVLVASWDGRGGWPRVGLALPRRPWGASGGWWACRRDPWWAAESSALRAA